MQLILERRQPRFELNDRFHLDFDLHVVLLVLGCGLESAEKGSTVCVWAVNENHLREREETFVFLALFLFVFFSIFFTKKRRCIFSSSKNIFWDPNCMELSDFEAWFLKFWFKHLLVLTSVLKYVKCCKFKSIIYRAPEKRSFVPPLFIIVHLFEMGYLQF